MSLLCRPGSPRTRRTHRPPSRRLSVQPLEDRAVPATFSQLTVSAGGFVGAPAVNADGNWVAFRSDLDLTGQNADGNAEVFLHDAAAGTFTQVTNSTGFSSVFDPPAISGDGTRVVFTSNLDLTGQNADLNAEVFLYDRTTGTLTQVTDTTGGATVANFGATVSADGTRLGFASTRDLVAGQNADGNAELFLYDVAAGTFTQVTNTTGAFFSSVMSPALSTDGSKVAFLSNRDLVPGSNADGGLEYFLYDAGSGSFRQLTNITVAGGTFGAPRVSGDGARVSFSTTHDLTGQNADGNEEVFLFDAAAGLRQLTQTAGTDVAPVSAFVGGVSGNGARVVVSSNADLTGGNADGNWEVFLFDVAAGNFTQLTDTAGASCDVPAVCASGVHIAFLSTADLSGANADGSLEVFVARTEAPPQPPPPPPPPTTPPTAAQRIALLIADVRALVETGRLTAARGQALICKLQWAQRLLERGRVGAAVLFLKAFAVHTSLLVRAGRLPAADGQPLVTTALDIVAQLRQR